MVVYNKNILASILLTVLSTVGMVAQEGIPAPPPPRPAGGPIPPGYPIDDNLIVLFVVALIYGVYISMKLSKKAKEV